MGLIASFHAYLDIKKDNSLPVEEFHTAFLNARYELLAALRESEIYCGMRIEFFDNVAQCAYRKGRAVDIPALLKQGKAKVEIGYLNFRGRGEYAFIPIALAEEDLKELYKPLPKPDPIIQKLPFLDFVEQAIENVNEQHDLRLYGDGEFVRISREECLMLKGAFDRKAFDAHIAEVEADYQEKNDESFIDALASFSPKA